jgi:hypothetical protein
MISADLDKSQLVLRFTFAQRVGQDEMTASLDQVLKLISQAKRGFTLLTDLSQLESMDLACGPLIDKTMDACCRAGIRKVIRVVPDPTRDIGFGIMSLFHYGPEVRIVTCKTLEEAESVLHPS